VPTKNFPNPADTAMKMTRFLKRYLTDMLSEENRSRWNRDTAKMYEELITGAEDVQSDAIRDLGDADRMARDLEEGAEEIGAKVSREDLKKYAEKVSKAVEKLKDEKVAKKIVHLGTKAAKEVEREAGKISKFLKTSLV